MEEGNGETGGWGGRDEEKRLRVGGRGDHKVENKHDFSCCQKEAMSFSR